MCAVVCSLFVAVGALGASTALATTRTLTFPYDGLTGVEGVPQFWEVPPKVYLVTFRVFGAQGGKRPGRPYSGAGGRGGEVTATLPVKPGELFEINVGGMPGNGRTGKLLGLFSSGGFNGGGAGGGGPYMGGGGGGASDVRHSPFGLTERLLVAGGGGGGGAPGSGSELIGSYIGPGDGGAGGGMSGRGGNAGGCGSPGGGGGNDRGGGAGASCVLPGPEPQGGSQDSGGHGGLPNGESCLEYGGSAPGGGVYDYTRTFIGGGGGGGGGGYYGGGGGGAGDASSGYHIDPYDSAQNFTYCYGDGGSGGGGGSGFGRRERSSAAGRAGVTGS
jgi:hypothetical protein